MENITDIALFIEVAKRQSFSVAAKSLNIQKSTLSRRISSLEDSLGVTLLRRTTRQVTLTTDGEKYFEACHEQVSALLNAKNVLEKNQKTLSGEIRLTAPVVLGQSLLPRVLNKFLALHPDCQVTLQLEDKASDLIADRFDLAIRAGPLQDSSLKVRRLGQNRFILVAHPKFLSHSKKVHHPRDLEQIAAIIFRRPSGDFPWQLQKPDSRVKVEPKVRIRVNNLEMARSLCLDSLGVALLPTFLCRHDLKTGRLIQLLPDWAGERSPVSILHPAEAYPRRLIAVFLDFLVAEISQQLQE